jgi:cyclase
MSLLEELAGEAFMPIAYGGGIKEKHVGRSLIELGMEKLVINTAQTTAPGLIPELAGVLGSQAVVGSVDYRSRRRGTDAFTLAGSKKLGRTAVESAQHLEELGVGEIFLNSIDRDGMMGGYDVQVIREVASAVEVPVLASGGAGSLLDMRAALSAGASAVAAGSMFVFHGRHRAVLITYPDRQEIADLIRSS